MDGSLDLPSPLDNILESDDEDTEPNFSESDLFDPQSLLSEPIFNDSQGRLDLSAAELDDLAPVTTIDSSAVLALQQQQQQLPFQQNPEMTSSLPQQFTGFNPTEPLNQEQLNAMQAQALNSFQSQQQHPGTLPNMGNQQQAAVQLQVQEVQQKIQQVQQQIQQVQLQGAGSMMDMPQNSEDVMQQHAMLSQPNHGPPQMPSRTGPPVMPQRGNYVDVSFDGQMQSPQQQQHQQMRQQQQLEMEQEHQRQLQALVNPAGMSGRVPPGRSVSMPLSRRNAGGMSSPTMGQGSSNPLTLMQQHQLQQMQAKLNEQTMQMNFQDSSNSLNMNNMGMMQQGQQQQQQMMNMNQMGHASFGPGGVSRQNSLGGSQGGSMQGMVHPSLANPGELLPTGSFDPSAILQQQHQQQQQQQGTQQGGKSGNVNEAMEKLCESMRRSAMSRSMVKQMSGKSGISGRSVSRQGSARLTKQMSGRSLARANSGRSIGRANSGRAVQRSHSGRDDMPVRRFGQDPKHRLGAMISPNGPQRGVFRHKSDMTGRKPSLPFNENPSGGGAF